MKDRFWMLAVLLFLTLSFPFVSAEITSIDIYGEDSIPNFLRDQDTLHIDVRVEVPLGFTAVTLLPRMRIGSSTLFDECVDVSPGVIDCFYSESFFAYGENVFPTTINRLDSADNVVESVSTQFYVDNYEPTADLVSGQSGQSIAVIGEVIDSAYPGADVCVGLQSLSAVASIDGVSGSPVDLELSGCSFGLDIDVPLPATFGETATVTVTILDVFGNSELYSQSTVIDNQPPQISDVSIIDASGTEIDYVGPSFSGTGFVTFSAFDNQELVDNSLTINGGPYPLTCTLDEVTSDGFYYTCMSGAFGIAGDSGYDVFTTVTDVGGNTVDYGQLFTIAVDSTAPVFSVARGGVEHDGLRYIGTGMPLILDIQDQESGFDYSNIQAKADVGTWIPATACTKAASIWSCRFEDSGLSHGQSTKFRNVQGEDDAGNAFTAQYEYSVIQDSQAPVVEEARLYSIVNQQQVDNLVAFNGEIFGEIIVSDDLPVSGSANISAFGGPTQTVAVSCDAGTCVFSGYVGDVAILDDVIITLEDAVGNTVVVFEELAAVPIVDGELQQVVADVVVNPQTFDRSVGRLINQIAYADLAFSVVGGIPVAVGFDSCQSAEDSEVNGNDVNFFQSIDEIDEFAIDDVTRRLKFTLKATELDINRLSLDCSFRFAYLLPGEGLVTDEVISFPVAFSFGNGLGGLPDNYQEKLDEAYEGANEGILNKIASFEKYVAIAQSICRIWATIKGLINSLQAVLTALNLPVAMLDSVGNFFGPAKAQAYQLRVTGGNLCTTQETVQAATGGSIGNIVGKFCQFVNCEWSLTSYLLDGGFDGLSGVFSFGGGSSDGTLQGGDDPTAPPAPEPAGGTIQDGDSDDYTFSGLDDLGSKNAVYAAELTGPNGEDTQFTRAWNRGIEATAARTEDSLVLSTLNLCIPGIIKNLHEYRQIQCRYALCLQDEVPNGVPIEACEAERSYAQCKYVMGEIFVLIPFVALFDQFMNTIKQALSDPITLIGSLWGGLCAATCPGGWLAGIPPEGLHSICALERIIRDLGVAVGHVMSIVNGDAFDFTGGPDACEELDDEE